MKIVDSFAARGRDDPRRSPSKDDVDVRRALVRSSSLK